MTCATQIDKTNVASPLLKPKQETLGCKTALPCGLGDHGPCYAAGAGASGPPGFRAAPLCRGARGRFSKVNILMFLPNPGTELLHAYIS